MWLVPEYFYSLFEILVLRIFRMMLILLDFRTALEGSKREAYILLKFTKASRGEMSYRVIATAYIVCSLYILLLYGTVLGSPLLLTDNNYS
jgi:hypothetical protein